MKGRLHKLSDRRWQFFLGSHVFYIKREPDGWVVENGRDETDWTRFTECQDVDSLCLELEETLSVKGDLKQQSKPKRTQFDIKKPYRVEPLQGITVINFAEEPPQSCDNKPSFKGKLIKVKWYKDSYNDKTEYDYFINNRRYYVIESKRNKSFEYTYYALENNKWNTGTTVFNKININEICCLIDEELHHERSSTI